MAAVLSMVGLKEATPSVASFDARSFLFLNAFLVLFRIQSCKIYQRLGRSQEALRDYNIAIDLDPQEAAVLKVPAA